jgi:hypothetical protein
MARQDYVTADDFEITQKEKLLAEAIFGGLPQSVAKKHAGYAASAVVKNIMEKSNVAKYFKYLSITSKKKVHYTRESIAEGIAEAIEDAKLIGDPMAQIRGWTEIGKMYGHYAPEVKRIEVTTSQQQLLDQVGSAPVEELVELAEAPALEGSFEVIPEYEDED